MFRKPGIKEMLFLGTQLILAVDPIAFDLEQLFSDTLPLHWGQTWNFVEYFSQAHSRSLADGGRWFNCHHPYFPDAGWSAGRMSSSATAASV